MKKGCCVFGVLLLSSLAACSRIAGEQGVFHDRSHAYLRSQNGPSLVLPQGVKAKNISHYYDIPAIQGEVAVNKAPPGSPATQAGLADRPTLPPISAKDIQFAEVEQQPTLLVREPIGRAWPLVADALQRQKMTIVREDKAKKIYVVMNRSASPDSPLAEVEVHLLPSGDKTEIRLLTKEGKTFETKSTQRLLFALADGLEGHRKFAVVPNYAMVI